jgi:hypothetical protein
MRAQPYVHSAHTEDAPRFRCALTAPRRAAGFAADAVAVAGPTDIASAIKNPSAEI